jgi:16S rRNA processing protein RimM
MINHSKLILIGIIGSPSGVRGDLVVKSFTSPVTNIGKIAIVNKAMEKIKLTIIRQRSNGDLICRLNNISTRNDAESLRGIKLFCLRSSLPCPDEDEFYVEDLKALPVVNDKLITIGKIADVHNFGAGEIIEIKFHEGKAELFPFTKELFPVITNDYVMFMQPDN